MVIAGIDYRNLFLLFLWEERGKLMYKRGILIQEILLIGLFIVSIPYIL